MSAADELIREGYAGLCLSGDHSTARTMYERHDLQTVRGMGYRLRDAEGG